MSHSLTHVPNTRTFKRNLESVEQCLQIKLDYLSDLEYDVQILSLETYKEIQNLKDTNNIEIPSSLTNKISNVLNKLNEEINKNCRLTEDNKQVTELLKKEAERSVHFESKFKKELENSENLLKEWESNEKKTKELEKSLREEISRLNVSIQQTRMSTTDESHIAATSSNTVINTDHNTEPEDPDITEIHLDQTEETFSYVSLPRRNTGVASSTQRASDPHDVNVVIKSSVDALTKANVGPRKGPEPLANQSRTPDNGSQDDKSTNSNAVNSGRILHFIGDSHCNGLGNIVKPLLNASNKVTCESQRGRKLEAIVNSIKPNKITSNTDICFIGGTNDLFSTEFHVIKESFEKLYNKCRNHKVLVVLVPPRYDVRGVNSHIRKLNVKIKHCVKNYENFQCLDPASFIHHTHFSVDYVHLNRKGKNILCSKIVNKLYSQQVSDVRPNTKQSKHTDKSMYNNSSHGNKRNKYSDFNRNQYLPPRFRNKQNNDTQHVYRHDNKRGPNQRDDPPSSRYFSVPGPPAQCTSHSSPDTHHTHTPPHSFPYPPYNPHHTPYFTYQLVPSIFPPSQNPIPYYHAGSVPTDNHHRYLVNPLTPPNPTTNLPLPHPTTYLPVLPHGPPPATTHTRSHLSQQTVSHPQHLSQHPPNYIPPPPPPHTTNVPVSEYLNEPSTLALHYQNSNIQGGGHQYHCDPPNTQQSFR